MGGQCHWWILILFSVVLVKAVPGDLETLKAFYNSTNGDYWINNSGWSGNDTSKFFGVSYAAQLIVKIELPNNNLTGTIPENFASLASLSQLDLSGNNLSGIIPKLQVSSFMDLSRNFFNDIVDNNILPVTELNLSGNKFNGSIPSWILHLPALQRLHLHSNSFDGTLLLPNSSTLYYLDVATNYLTDITGNSSNLQTLDVSYNMLGKIPPDVFTLPKLQFLRMVSCGITGAVTLPVSRLDNLNLGNNSITAINPGSTNIQTLNLFSNPISDMSFICMDKGMCPFSSLQSIDLSSANLTGPACQICSPVLTSLDLSQNKLTGPVDNFAHLYNLVKLNLNYNMLNGTLNSFSDLLSLEELSLNNNHFDGTLPSSLPRSLKTLEIGNNNLTGTIPSNWGEIHLTSINLSNNSLCGCFPDEWKDTPWSTCNINGISQNCACTSMYCTGHCDAFNTVSCDGNPCKSSLCTEGRVCIPNADGYSYSCTTNCTLFYIPSTSSPFACDVDPKVVLSLQITLPFIFVLTLVCALCTIFPRKTTAKNDYSPPNYLDQ